MATINSWNSNNPAEVAKGGTGAATLTNHGVLVGAGTSSITQLAVGGNNTVLQGTAASDPAFTATPTVTSITLGSGSALSTYIGTTSFTPTLVGRSTAGATSYSIQQGYYTQIGSRVFVDIFIVTTAQTGTGDVLIGALPATISSSSNYSCVGAAILQGLTWPVSTTSVVLQGLSGTTTAVITGFGSVATRSNVQMANAATVLIASMVYSV